jgi:hypothetical protein
MIYLERKLLVKCTTVGIMASLFNAGYMVCDTPCLPYAMRRLRWKIMEYLQSIDDSGNITKDCQQDTDQKISTTSSLGEVSNSLSAWKTMGFLPQGIHQEVGG